MTADLRLTEETLGALRGTLVGYCYRMLADATEAEDAAQETMLRAWRARDRFEPDRGTLRTWVLSIATRVCIDFGRSPQRRALPVEATPASRPGDAIGEQQHARWISPLPDPTGGDPAHAATLRDSVRLALVAAMQRLPPTQRAAILLRDVYQLSAQETADLLGTTDTAVHSAVRRARATLEHDTPPADSAAVSQETLDRYVAAFEAHDLEALAGLLHAEVTMSMPPFPFWLSGRDDVLDAFASGEGCVGHRLLATTANGAPAFGQYRPVTPDDDVPTAEVSHVPFALLVVGWQGGHARTLTTFLDASVRLEEFGLPSSLAVG